MTCLVEYLKTKTKESKMKSITEKIKEATESRTSETKNCNQCEVQGFCDETQDYFGLNFCDNSAEEIINALYNNRESEETKSTNSENLTINNDKLHLNVKG